VAVTNLGLAQLVFAPVELLAADEALLVGAAVALHLALRRGKGHGGEVRRLLASARLGVGSSGTSWADVS
jgi:hypothetical protein